MSISDPAPDATTQDLDRRIILVTQAGLPIDPRPYDRVAEQLGVDSEQVKSRIEAMLTEDPSDIFLRYSLAMEMAKEGEHDESLRRLRELADESPPYIPAFFMAGQQLAQQSRFEEARTVLREGIEQARTQGDLHAAGEMSELLATLGPAGE